MEVKPGYKATVLGPLPEDWEIPSLQGISRTLITYGIVQCGPHIENGVPYIRVSDMDSSELDVTQMLRTSPAIAAKFSRSTVQEGDLVYALRGKLGEVRLVKREVAGANLTQGTARIAPREGVLGIFLFWAMQSPQVVRQAEVEAKGTTFREITLADLRRISVPLPPTKSEQLAIGTALSDVDALIQSLDQLIAKKRDLKQAAMQQLLTGQTRLPGFQGKWEMKRLGDLATIKDGTHQTPRYIDSGIPFYSVEHVTSGNFKDTKFISEEEHRFLTRSTKIEKGDILMTRIGSIGDCKLIDWDVEASFYVSLALLKIRTGCSAAFIAHYSNTAAFKKEVEMHSLQSAIPKKINLGPISDVQIELPPTLAEQNAIAEVLTAMDTELAALEQRREKTIALKQGMMQELLTGKTRLV